MSESVSSREYKALLRTERFADPVEGVKRFWSHVKAVHDDRVKGKMRKVTRRRVWYRDTTTHELFHTHHLSIRERWGLDDNGAPCPNKKISVKFRHDRLDHALERLPRAAHGDDREAKVEEDVLLVPGGDHSDPALLVKYSSSAGATVGVERNFETLGAVAAVFPILGDRVDQPLPRVRDTVVHEIKFWGGRITLGAECVARASFTLWYESVGGEFASGPLVAAEFSFQADDECLRRDRKAKRLLLALASPRWMDRGGETKTAVAYG